jgi:hypothetical protein
VLRTAAPELISGRLRHILMVELPVTTVPPGFQPILSKRVLRLRTSPSKGCCCAKPVVNPPKKIKIRKIDFFISLSLIGLEN